MRTRKEVLTEWLSVYRIEDIYVELSHIGNYNIWKENFAKLLGTHFNHPLTVVLLTKMSLSNLTYKIETLLLEKCGMDWNSGWKYYLGARNDTRIVGDNFWQYLRSQK